MVRAVSDRETFAELTSLIAVSQFTLCANVRKGSKPDFHGAMPGDASQTMYLNFLEDLRKKYRADRIFDGKFGAMMDVSLLNDVRSKP